MDTHSWVLWVGVIAAGLHVLEEYAEGWVYWANEELGPRFGIHVTEAEFFITNALLVFSALAAAAIGWWAPAVSLAVPALFIINAVFFHMLPTARGGRLTPGTLSAVFIYLPVAAWMFAAAADDDVLSFGTVVLSFVLGAALMAYPIAVLVARNRIGWGPETAAADSHPVTQMRLGDQPEAAEPDEPPTTVIVEEETVVIVEESPAPPEDPKLP